MKSDDGFTMRQLNEGDLEQFNALLRYAFQVTTTEMVKTGWSEEEIKREKLPMLTEGYVLGWFHGDQLASQIVIYPMEVNVEGEILKMGGITGVTTYPEYAGRGLAHRLMSECLKHMRKERQLISFLCPYSFPFYRKMGWEIVSDKLTFSLRDTQLPRRQEVPGMVERVDLESEDLKNVHEYFAVQRHGCMLRNELAWHEYWRWDNDDMIAAIYYSEKHKPLGYLVYYIEDEIFHVKEMVYLNLEARHGLWNYISAHFSMITEVRGANYSGEPLAFLFDDSEIEETISPYVMARIVDVREFLLAYNWQNTPEDLRIFFQVTDPLAEWNNGTFLLYWQDEKTYCEKVDSDEAVNAIRLDVGTLTAMLMGYKRPTYLYRNDRLDMEYYWVRILEQLIHHDKPYFSDYF